MASITHWIKQHYNLTVKDNIYDAEVDSWFLMDSITPIIAIVAVYLFFVLKVGPQMMENRKPYALKTVLLVYNFAITLFNAYIFSTFLTGADYPIANLCVPPPNKNSLPFMRIMYKTSWYYLMSKIIELLDTVFFVFRKKQSQVTNLHVYHHASMVVHTWLYLKYLKTEQGIIVGLINSFVHIIMYLYYFLAALGPNVQKYLWWKKYITVIQLIQFGIILTFLSTLLILDCEVHRSLSVYMVTNTIVFITMFSNFYRKEYFKDRSKIHSNNWNSTALKSE